MSTIVIIITLQLFSSGVVIKTTEEIHLPSSVECYSVVDSYAARHKDTEDKKLISISCKTIGDT